MVVRKRLVGIGITVGLIIAVIFVAKKLNLGGQVIEGFGGFGETIGASLLAIPKGIISGGAQGTGDLALEAVKISEEFQRFVNEGRLFSQPSPEQSTNIILPGAEGATFNFSEILKQFTPPPGEEIIFPSTAIIEGGGGSFLEIFGTRGIVTNEISILGKTLAPRAISRTEPTLVGTVTTAAGGTRVITGSAGLFERIRQNLERAGLSINFQQTNPPLTTQQVSPITQSGQFIQKVDFFGRPIRSF